MHNNSLLAGGGYAFTSTNSVGAEVRRNFGVLTLSFPILHRSLLARVDGFHRLAKLTMTYECVLTAHCVRSCLEMVSSVTNYYTLCTVQPISPITTYSELQ